MYMGTKKACAFGLALLLVLAGGMAALAEEDAAAAVKQGTARQGKGSLVLRQGLGMGGQGSIFFGMGAQAQWTDEQKQAVTAAQSAYDAAEDEVLAEMAEAGALTQEAVGRYQAQRNAQRQIAQKDYSDWTLDQVQALRQAVGRNQVNETILAGLVSQGALTQEEADTFKLAYGQSVNIWSQVDTSKATQGMMTKLQEARQAYRQALSDAGVGGRGLIK